MDSVLGLSFFGFDACTLCPCASLVGIPHSHSSVPIFQLAVVAMLLCIDDFSHWDPALNDMIYLWTEEERRQAMRLYNTSVSALHPWKLTYPAYGRLLLLHMAKGDPSLKRLLPLFDFK